MWKFIINEINVEYLYSSLYLAKRKGKTALVFSIKLLELYNTFEKITQLIIGKKVRKSDRYYICDLIQKLILKVGKGIITENRGRTCFILLLSHNTVNVKSKGHLSE